MSLLSSHYTKNMIVEGAVFSKIYNLATIQPRAILNLLVKSK